MFLPNLRGVCSPRSKTDTRTGLQITLLTIFQVIQYQYLYEMKNLICKIFLLPNWLKLFNFNSEYQLLNWRQWCWSVSRTPALPMAPTTTRVQIASSAERKFFVLWSIVVGLKKTKFIISLFPPNHYSNWYIYIGLIPVQAK